MWNADAGSVAPNYTYTGTPFVRFVGRYVITSGTTPIFTYLDVNGNALRTRRCRPPISSRCDAVRITLTVKKTTTAPLAPVTLVNRVRLPNLDYAAASG